MTDDSPAVKFNNRIRWAARGLAGTEYLDTDEAIVAAVETRINETLDEYHQRIAIRAYTNHRNLYLHQQDKALQRQQA